MTDGPALDVRALREWLAAQRWFAAKGRELREVRALETFTLRGESPVLLALVETRFAAGPPERYQVLLGTHRGASDGALAFDDAVGDPREGALLAGLFGGERTLRGAHGDVGFHRADGAAPMGVDPVVRPMGVEQSNSSVILDETSVLKVFRRLEDGESPELEMLRELTAQGFDSIARLQGWYAYAAGDTQVTLGVLQEFVGDATDGWTLALAAIAAGDGGIFDRLGVLGGVTGAMHTALGRAAGTDFAAEPFGADALTALTAAIDGQIERRWRALGEGAAELVGRDGALRERVRAMGRAGIGGRLIRHHGDFHLGQTLARPDGRWVIIDFEGEPARSLQDRRRRQSPLRDVAGMLRSFAYAASASAVLHGTPAPADWEARARAAFLDGYLEHVDPALLPAGRPATDELLGLFELEKAVYELGYEIDNRPAWVGIPAAGIARLLQEPLPA